MTLHAAGRRSKCSISMPAPPTTPDPYAPWRNPDYRRYAGSWFLITFSRRIEFVAVSIHLAKTFSADASVVRLGDDGTGAGAAGDAAGDCGRAPCRPFQPPQRDAVDVLAGHRLLRRPAGRGAVGRARSAWIYLLLGIGAVGWALGNPARQALLPQLVPAELFSNAVAWNSSVFYIASVTGPVVGGAIVGVVRRAWGWPRPSPWSLLCRLVAVAGIALIRDRRTGRAEQSVSWESVVAGIRFVWHTKLILATITLDLFAVLLGGATYLLPIYAKDILHVGPLGAGVPAVGRRRRAPSAWPCCWPTGRRCGAPARRCSGPSRASAWPRIVFGLSQWFWLSLVMMFLVGALDNISVVVRHTLVQMLTPDEMRGRVSAVNGVFIVASNDLGGLESGLTAGLFGRMFGPALGPVISVVGGGVGTILVVLGAMRLWPQLLKIGSLASIRPASPEEPDRDGS